MTTLHSPEYRHLTLALAKARIDAGLTQRGLAQLLDTDHTFIAKYEKARVRLDVIQFIRIAQVLKIDISTFIAELPDISEVRLLSPRSRARRIAG